MKIKKEQTAAYRAKVALAALREEKTTSELGAEYGAHPINVGLWKKTLKTRAFELFEKKGKADHRNEQEELIEKLYRKIGEVEVENDWLKKKLGL